MLAVRRSDCRAVTMYRRRPMPILSGNMKPETRRNGAGLDKKRTFLVNFDKKGKSCTGSELP